MSALTLLAFLFFLHILQQCIKDHISDMSSASPIVVMTAGREGDELIPKSAANKIDKTGVTHIENDRKNVKKQKDVIDTKNPYGKDDLVSKNPILVFTNTQTAKPNEQKFRYAYKNNTGQSSILTGYVNAMDET